MSDARDISGPPPRRGGAASLIKGNRGAVTVEPAAAEEADQSRVIAGPPPAPRAPHVQAIASPPEVDLPVQAAVESSATPTTAAVITPSSTTTPAPEPAATVTPEMPVVEPTTPYTRRRGAVSDENPNDIIKVTFEIRRGDRDAFNAAFGAARMMEGYETPKELLQEIYNRETARLQDQYNAGNPFPRRTRQLPRGRPINAD